MANELERLEQVLAGVRQIDTETFVDNAVSLSVETAPLIDNFVGYGTEIGVKLLELGAGLVSALEKQEFEFNIKCEDERKACRPHFCNGKDCRQQISIKNQEIVLSTYHSYHSDYSAYDCKLQIIPHKTLIRINYNTLTDRIRGVSGICSFKKENPEEAFKILSNHYHPGAPEYITDFVEEFFSMPLLLDSVVNKMRKGAQMQQALEDKMEAIRRLGR